MVHQWHNVLTDNGNRIGSTSNVLTIPSPALADNAIILLCRTSMERDEQLAVDDLTPGPR